MNSADTSRLTRRGFLAAAGSGAAVASVAPALLAEQASPTAIPLREFGRTGEKAPMIGVGTAPAGFRGYREAVGVYEKCWERGLRYFDTAPEFAGYGKAQVALGDVLKSRRKDAFVVTKCWDADGEKALAILKKNLQDLKTDYADVVYAHAIGADNMPPDVVLGPRGVMKALAKAQRDGLARFIGVSGHNRPDRFLRVLRECEIQVMMTAANFVVRNTYEFETKVWPEAHKKGVALVAMKVYGGLLHGEKAPKGARLPNEYLHDAFRYAQGLPGVATVVVGMHDEIEMEQAIDWAVNYKPLDEQEMTTLLARGKELAPIWGEVFGAVV